MYNIYRHFLPVESSFAIRYTHPLCLSSDVFIFIVMCRLFFFFSLPLRTVESKNKWGARRDNCHWIFAGLPNMLLKHPGINPYLTGDRSLGLYKMSMRANFGKLLLNHKIIEFWRTFWGHLVHPKPQTGSWYLVTSEANQLSQMEMPQPLYKICCNALCISHPVEPL